jgi:hypothetical protein
MAQKPKEKKKRGKPVRVFLVIRVGLCEEVYELKHNKTVRIMTTLNVGHQDKMTIVYLDQNGNPMQSPVTPDAPPSWSNSPNPPDCDTFVVASDGNSAILTAVAEGSDTVNLSVTVNGKTFAAVDMITIVAAPQVLTSVSIADNVT